MLVVNVIRAKFAPKKDYMAVAKSGYVLFEFMRANQAENKFQVVDWNDKRVFAMEVRKAMNFSRLSVEVKPQEVMYRTGGDTFDSKQMTVQIGVGGRGHKIIFEQKGRENDSVEVSLEDEDILMIQKMIDYGLPYMMGWHTWGTGKLNEDDITTTQINR